MSSAKNKILVSSLIVTLNGHAQAPDYQIHRVKEGETLSQILESYELSPIYPPKGSLENTIELNPQLLENKGDLIFPGQNLKIQKSLPLKEGEEGEEEEKLSPSPLNSQPKSSSQELSQGEFSEPSEGPEFSEASPLSSKSSQEPSQESYQEPPSQKEEEKEKREESEQSDDTLTLSLLSGQLSVLGKDRGEKEGEILSKISFGLGGKWRTKISSHYALNFSVDLIKLSIEDTLSSTLTKRSQILKDIGLSLDAQLSWAKLEGGYHLFDQIFYRSVGTNSFQVSTMTTSQAFIQGERKIFQYHRSRLNLGVNANYNFFNAPDGIDVDPSFGGKIFLKYEHLNRQKKDSTGLAATFGYEMRSFNSNQTDMDYKALFLRFDYTFDFLKGE